jgi:hypothetical protein
MKLHSSYGSGWREINACAGQAPSNRERAERLYLMGELQAAAELLMQETKQ